MSKICILGRKPRSDRYVYSSLCAFRSSSCDLFLSAFVSIEFVSVSNMTRIYLLPVFDVTGNLPVWSENVLCSSSITFVDVRFCRSRVCEVIIISS